MSRAARFAGVLLLVIALMTVACVTETGLFKWRSSPEGIDLVEEAWQVLLRDFADSQHLDDNELAEGAIRGLVEALNDPYTTYLNAEQYELSRTQLEGGFSGIGATITITEGQLTIVAPIAGTPAERAGIRPGDVILQIDGESTSELTLKEAQMKIRGKKGTQVRLLVAHPPEDTPVEIVITRDEIELPSVEWEMLPEHIAHITITNFSERTDSEFALALVDAQASGATGIILDLRYNPGGIVSAAVGVVSQFIEEGIVLYALDNAGQRIEWQVQEAGNALEIPLIVLVNGHSASASEVVSGAIQDYGRGVIMGSKTFGKGSMNRVNRLSNGGALYVTYARWFTPDGRQIDNEGITPDVEIEMTSEDIENGRDPQLEKALEYFRQ